MRDSDILQGDELTYHVDERIRQSGCSRVHSKHFSSGHLVGSLFVFLGGWASLAGRDGVDVGEDGAELEGVDSGEARGVDDAETICAVVSENVAEIDVVEEGTVDVVVVVLLLPESTSGFVSMAGEA